MSPGNDLESAISHYQSGRLKEAAIECQDLLRKSPDRPDALHLLGVCHMQLGDYAEAIRTISLSISIEGNNSNAHNSLGVALHKSGRLDEAIFSFSRATTLDSRNLSAFVNLGNALESLGKSSEALACYDRAEKAGLRHAAISLNRGISLFTLQRTEESLESFENAISIDPLLARAHFNRAEALRVLRRFNDALSAYSRSMELEPESAVIYNGLGVALNELDRADEALTAFDKSIVLDPLHAGAHANRGRMLAALGRSEEAIESTFRAANLEPESTRILSDLGNLLLAFRRFAEAADCFRRIVALDPDTPFALGHLLHSTMQLCEWQEYEVLEARVIDAIRNEKRPASPFTILSIPSSLSDQFQCAKSFADQLHPDRSESLPHKRTRSRDKIVVAYFSSDFHDHATSHLVAEMLELHDRSNFRVIALSYGPNKADNWRRRIENGVDLFIDVEDQSPRQMVSLARDLEVDIAVDLKGFTSGARTSVFAMRPAPVAVNFLGYPGTMGAAYYDFVIADRVLVSPGDEDYYSESVVLLPHCYQPNDSHKRIAAATLTREDLGLPRDGFVYCCFNGFFKITPDVFDTWMRILKAVPGSTLWMIEHNMEGARNLRGEAERRGISGERLVFSRKVALEDHLARHRLADLFLDTFYCTAHTTASDSLWAGVPLLAKRGRTFAGRVSQSLLHAAGIPDLVVDTVEQYEEAAIRLASEPGAIEGFRRTLARGRAECPLFDTPRYIMDLERAYIEMQKMSQANLPFGRIVIN